MADYAAILKAVLNIDTNIIGAAAIIKENILAEVKTGRQQLKNQIWSEWQHKPSRL